MIKLTKKKKNFLSNLITDVIEWVRYVRNDCMRNRRRVFVKYQSDPGFITYLKSIHFT